MGTVDQIGQAVEALRGGGVVAFPTETVYGLGADALNAEAVAKVFALKGRPAHNPLIVHVTGREMALQAAAEWPGEAAKLAEAFWPGPLSIVLPKRPELPGAVTAGGPTVAVRCPDHPLALALLYALGRPLVGPSANPSGRVSPTRAEHVREAFPELLVLDGGACAMGIESTVVRVLGDRAEVLRPGLIGAERIGEVLGRRVDAAGARVGGVEGGGVLASPGMLTSHYAPATPVVVFGEEDWPRVVEEAGGPVVVLTWKGRSVAAPHHVFRMPREAGEYAAVLYSALREADRMGAVRIAVERVPEGGGGAEGAIWGAVADRLRRAGATTRGL